MTFCTLSVFGAVLTSSCYVGATFSGTVGVGATGYDASGAGYCFTAGAGLGSSFTGAIGSRFLLGFTGSFSYYFDYLFALSSRVLDSELPMLAFSL